MEGKHGDEENASYTIPSRTISGSVPELLEEIDDMMDALRTVREAVERRAPKLAHPTNGHHGWRARLVRLLGRNHRAA